MSDIGGIEGSVEAVGGGSGSSGGGGFGGSSDGGGGSGTLDTVAGGLGAAGAGVLEMLGFSSLAGALGIAVGGFVAIDAATPASAFSGMTLDQAASFGAPFASSNYAGQQ